MRGGDGRGDPLDAFKLEASESTVESKNLNLRSLASEWMLFPEYVSFVSFM